MNHNQTVLQWSILVLTFEAERDHTWWASPVQAVFTHTESGAEVALHGFWDGGRTWRVRWTPALPGEWRWRTESADPGLANRTGRVVAVAPMPEQVEANPNYRGHIRIAANGRHFEYADGTPFFLMADTLWAGNSARCGLGANEDGPFFRYLADRRAQGFSAILMCYMRGFGDTTNEPAGQRNEGGHPFVGSDASRLNPAYFAALDERMDALWRRGLVAATPVTWFGKMCNCFFSFEEAKRISRYLMTRYGAYNTVWSLSGEYQYIFRDCGWSAEQISELGREVQRYNAYRRPLSIHPSGRTDWPAPHGSQSSRAYHDTDWLDHNWLQTGQSIDRMHCIAKRLHECRALTPTKPAFLAEAYYERPLHIDPEAAYHARWQAWCAFLCGAAGYGYGAFGVWQFYDPDDPGGETGKRVKGVVPWPQALAFDGSAQLRHVRDVLAPRPWWRLEPGREWISVDGKPCPMPTAADLTPPQGATVPGELWILYIPRGNARRTLSVGHLDSKAYTGTWVSPRDGSTAVVEAPPNGVEAWDLPPRPEPVDEDWAFVLERAQGLR